MHINCPLTWKPSPSKWQSSQKAQSLRGCAWNHERTYCLGGRFRLSSVWMHSIRSRSAPIEWLRWYILLDTFLDHAFELLTQLDMHIPTEIDRDARSKLVIITSDKNSVKSTDKTRTYTRWRRVYQCSCGIDNMVGHHGGKQREISWGNVACGAWFRLTSTHEDKKDSVFSSSPRCPYTFEGNSSLYS